MKGRFWGREKKKLGIKKTGGGGECKTGGWELWWGGRGQEVNEVGGRK